MELHLQDLTPQPLHSQSPKVRGYGLMPESFERTEDCRRPSEPIAFVQRDYVLGGIYLWSGSIASIPGTFRLCDGSLGTPDLRNRFLNCAGDSYVPGNTGGTINHNHPFTGDGHFHTIPTIGPLLQNANLGRETSTELTTGTTDNQDGRPPYHSLAYIMYAGRIH